MSEAIRNFLESAGIDLNQPQLIDTPDRVARSWREELLDGYDADPALILKDSFEADRNRLKLASGLVLVKDIPFHGLCPHHLLPLQGVAHIGYLPDGKLVPFSGLVRLLDCFAHRLEVQETVTKRVAEALMTHLGVKGAASVLESEQTCMTLRGVKRRGTRIVTSHFAGKFASRADLRSEFLRSIGRLE
jgi:GTP cyclohydrolase I